MPIRNAEELVCGFKEKVSPSGECDFFGMGID
jgi:hypothetical protein